MDCIFPIYNRVGISQLVTFFFIIILKVINSFGTANVILSINPHF